MELLIKLNIYEIVIVSVMVSFVVEGIAFIWRGVSKRVLLPVVALAVTVLRIYPLESLKFDEPSAMILNFVFTISFAILFYKYGGSRLVKALTGSISDRVINTTKAKENEPFE